MHKTERYEHKYIISYVQYQDIINMVKSTCIHDQYGSDLAYPVTTVYLDDIIYSGAADKAFGNRLHQKYRIRFYHDESKKKLELKEKIGDHTVKYSVPINEELYQGIIHQDFDIIDKYKDEQLIRKLLLDMKLNYLTPKVTILYQREAYKDQTNNLRITFDHQLYGDWYHPEDFDAHRKLIESNKIVLEIKYEHVMPHHLKALLKRINPNQIAFSKYFLGYLSLDI